MKISYKLQSTNSNSCLLNLKRTISLRSESAKSMVSLSVAVVVCGILCILPLVSCSQEVCQSPNSKFSLITDSHGVGVCGVSPGPLQVIDSTKHQGECLDSCARYPDCCSYNYHSDTTKCELFGSPDAFAIIPNCFNYLVSVQTFLYIWWMYWWQT